MSAHKFIVSIIVITIALASCKGSEDGYVKIESKRGKNYALVVNIQPHQMRHLANISQADILQFSDCHNHLDRDFQKLDAFPNLKELEMFSCTIGSNFWSWIARQNSLVSLYLSDCSFDEDVALKDVNNLGQLELMTMNSCKLSDKAFLGTVFPGKLRQIEVIDTQTGDYFASVCAKAPALRFLNMSGTKLTLKGVEELSYSCSLEGLKAFDTQLTTADLKRYFPSNLWLFLASKKRELDHPSPIFKCD